MNESNTNNYHINSNKLVSKSMRFTLLIGTIIFILSISHIYNNNITLDILCYVLSFILLLVPTILIDVLKKNDNWIKYLNILLSVLFSALLFSVFGYPVAMLLFFPIVLSCLYCNKKISVATIISCSVFLIIGTFVNFYIFKINCNFSSIIDEIEYRMVPFMVCYVCLSFIAYTAVIENTKLYCKFMASTNELKKRKDGLSHIISQSPSLFTARNYTDVAAIIMSEILDTYKFLYNTNDNIKCCVGIKINDNEVYRIDENYKPDTIDIDGIYVYDKLNSNYEFNLFNKKSSITFSKKNIIMTYYESNMLLSYIVLEVNIETTDYVLTSLFEILYNNICLGIKNASLTQDIFKTQEELIFSLAEISESKSSETGMHIKRVYEYTRIMAKAIGLNKRDEDNFALAAMMHDIGKLLIPSSILEKPGKLTDEEFEIMKKHVIYGNDLLKNSPGKIMKIAKNIALMHHEKWNGTGYLKMKGDEIDYYARIVAVIDVFDALVSTRCYKSSWLPSDAYNEIVSQSGRHFDPKVVNIFKDNYKEFLYILHKYPDEIKIEDIKI